MKVFLDMDGVIADFVAGTCALHGKDNPYTDKIADYDMASALGMRLEDFYTGMNQEFWEFLPKTEYADKVVDLLTTTFGVDNICILSTPTFNAGCIDGKREWLRHNYPQFMKQVIFTSSKHFCAHSGALLIDDYDKNIEEFRKDGGKAILFKQPWNSSKFLGDPYPDFENGLHLFCTRFL